MTNHQVEFVVPIIESKTVDGDFLIRGTAINATVTRNGVRYIEEELERSAETLRNKPILKDHTNSVDAIVGRTTESVDYNGANKHIDFEGRIVDKPTQEKIRQGLITSVSVGAIVEDLIETTNEDGDQDPFVTAKGIDFVELSLVAVPADPNAGFAKAIMEKFHSTKQNAKKQSQEKTKGGVNQMSVAEPEVKTEAAKPQPDAQEASAQDAEVTEQKVNVQLDTAGMAEAIKAAVKDGVAEVAKTVEKLQAEVTQLKESQEEGEAEEPAKPEEKEEPAKEEPKAETKGEVGEDSAEESSVVTEDNIVLTQEGVREGYAFFRMPSADGRLI